MLWFIYILFIINHKITLSLIFVVKETMRCGAHIAVNGKIPGNGGSWSLWAQEALLARWSRPGLDLSDLNFSFSMCLFIESRLSHWPVRSASRGALNPVREPASAEMEDALSVSIYSPLSSQGPFVALPVSPVKRFLSGLWFSSGQVQTPPGRPADFSGHGLFLLI